MKYLAEYSAGYSAAKSAAEPSTNPHIWKCPAWWAWHAGWEAGKADMADQFHRLLNEFDQPTIIAELGFTLGTCAGDKQTRR